MQTLGSRSLTSLYDSGTALLWGQLLGPQCLLHLGLERHWAWGPCLWLPSWEGTYGGGGGGGREGGTGAGKWPPLFLKQAAVARRH